MKAQRTIQALIAVLAVLVGAACGNPAFARSPKAVLFIGNSLTYVGNLPAVFDSIPLNGHSGTESDMLVAAGATLTERLRDGSVAKALSTKRYDVVVLQERGGDFACGFGPEVCRDSRQSLGKLAQLIKAHGALPILLGTYQTDKDVAAAIQAAESRAAAESKIEYVPVANLLTELRKRYPNLNWFASDGMHPGSDLTLLEALLLFKKVHGTAPPASAISVRAPIFALKAPPLEVRNSSSVKDISGVQDGVAYESDRVSVLLESIK